MNGAKMAPKRVLLLGLMSLALPLACGRSNGISRATMEQIRQAQARWLTVDAHVGAEVTARVLSQMKKGGLDAAFFVVSVPQGDPTPDGYARARATTLRALGRLRLGIEERSNLIGLASSPNDAYRLKKEGRLAVYIGLENGYAIGPDASLLGKYRDEGVCYLSLCGNRDNLICDSALDQADPEDHGLSEFGKEVVAECNRLGMIIDISNCSKNSIFDVLKASLSPVIVSRAAAWAICRAPGNLTDEMIRAIAAKGGVIMICLDPERLVAASGSRAATVADVVDHIDHVVKISGDEAVGIGSGFGSGGGISGCDSPREMLGLTIELLRRGYGEHSAEAIWGGNVMRVVRTAQDGAGSAPSGNRHAQ